MISFRLIRACESPCGCKDDQNTLAAFPIITVARSDRVWDKVTSFRIISRHRG